MIINPIDDDSFRRKLIENIGNIWHSKNKISKEELVDRLIDLFRATADQINSKVTDGNEADGYFFIDPETKLRLPPLPRIPYSGRTAKYSKRLSVEEFVRVEWGDYAKHYLLYTDHLRVIDYSLYKALYYRAREMAPAKTFAEYAMDLGILSRQHVMIGDPRFARQIELLRRARILTRAESTRLKAQQQLEPETKA